MLWGLWMDADRVGEDSRVAKEHPDWLAMNYEGERKMGGQLDLTNPDAAKWMEQQITRVIEENQLEILPARLQHRPGTRHTHSSRWLRRKRLLALLRHTLREFTTGCGRSFLT